jgi:YhcH/YjgK/YiaL family protein
MLEQTREYTAEKDAALWKLIPEVTELHMQPGHMAILYPEDAHAPCVQWEKEEQVFKVVIKVAVD